MDTEKKPSKIRWFVIGGGFLFTCLCILVVLMALFPTKEEPQKSTQVSVLTGQVTEILVPATEDNTPPTSTSTPSSTNTPAPSDTPLPTRTPTETPNPNLIKPGTYLVVDEIKPGIYRGEGSCYWERLKDVSGTFDAIIANGNTEGQFYVEIKDGDFAFSINCDMLALESLPEPSGETPQMIEPGAYLVGRDIKPGIYRGEGSCYWERLKDVSGGFDAIIANDNTEGQFYVEVKDGDFALSTSCEIISLESLPEPSGETPQIIEPGIYLVGRDIQPGNYRGEGSCYWERLKNVSGGFDAIIANDNTEGQFYIQVNESDFALSTSITAQGRAKSGRIA